VLPREFRDLGLLPNTGEIAAVFILGEVLEIWRSEKWVEHVLDVRKNLQQITGRALDELHTRQ